MSVQKISNQYEQIKERIKSFENKRDFAKKKGNNIKARQYSTIINDLNIKKSIYEKKLGIDNIKDSLEKELDQANEIISALNTKNRTLQDSIDSSNKKVAEVKDAINKKTAPPIRFKNVSKKPIKKMCPKCGRMFLESEMVQHQKDCLKSTG